jgi:polyhydroxyalkanoate synthesis regulator phasin
MKKIYDDTIKKEVIVYSIDDVMSELESVRDDIEELKKQIQALNTNVSTLIYAVISDDYEGVIIE